MSRIEEETKDTDVSYLDGILFGKDSGLICSGRFTDSPRPGMKVQKFTGPRDPWFYIHAERTLKRTTRRAGGRDYPVVQLFHARGKS